MLQHCSDSAGRATRRRRPHGGRGAVAPPRARSRGCRLKRRAWWLACWPFSLTRPAHLAPPCLPAAPLLGTPLRSLVSGCLAGQRAVPEMPPTFANSSVALVCRATSYVTPLVTAELLAHRTAPYVVGPGRGPRGNSARVRLLLLPVLSCRRGRLPRQVCQQGPAGGRESSPPHPTLLQIPPAAAAAAAPPAVLPAVAVLLRPYSSSALPHTAPATLLSLTCRCAPAAACPCRCCPVAEARERVLRGGPLG